MLSTFYCKKGISAERFILLNGYYRWNCLHFVTKGEYKLLIGDEWHTVKKGQFVIYPENAYFERYITSPVSSYTVRFHTDKDLQFEIYTVADYSRGKTSLEYMRILMKRDRKDRPYEVINHYLMDVLLSPVIENMTAETPLDDFIQKVKKYFEKNLHNKITLHETAAIMNVSKSTLVNYFNEKAGMSPMKFLATMRIKKAKTLLLDSSKSISEIAAECGYESAYYFSNSFKKEVKISPTAYRHKNI